MHGNQVIQTIPSAFEKRLSTAVERFIVNHLDPVNWVVSSSSKLLGFRALEMLEGELWFVAYRMISPTKIIAVLSPNLQG